MTRTITADEFVGAVREVLAERGPEYVYPVNKSFADSQCSYSRDGGTTGSCLYGVVLIEKFGLPYMAEWEGMPIHQILRNGHFAQARFVLGNEHIMAATWSQSYQDDEMPYGQVGEKFEAILDGGDPLA